MDSSKEQPGSGNIAAILKKKNPAPENYSMLRHVFGDTTISQVACFKWFASFKSGRESLKTERQSGLPVKSIPVQNIYRSRETIDKDQCPKLSVMLPRYRGYALDCKDVRPSKAPQLLTGTQKQQRIGICKIHKIFRFVRQQSLVNKL